MATPIALSISVGAAHPTIVSPPSKVLLPVACVSFLASSLALADRRERHRQLHLTLWVSFDRSLDQPFIGEPFARRSVNEAFQPRHGVVLHVALVEPESKFVNIAAKMFWAGMMVDADQATLKDRKNALNPVCGNIVANILASTVVDCLCSKDNLRMPS